MSDDVRDGRGFPLPGGEDKGEGAPEQGLRPSSAARLNVIRHGILSREALVNTGAGREDPAELETLRADLYAQAAPVGALELLLVDQLVMLAWRWRRVVRYESAIVADQADRGSLSWRRTDEGWEGGRGADHPDEDPLELECNRAVRDLDALDAPDPIAAQPLLWRRVFEVAAAQFGLVIGRVLAIKGPWHVHGSFSADRVRAVIAAACDQAMIAPDQFWAAVRVDATNSRDRAQAQSVARSERLKAVLARRSLPDEQPLDRVLRYEGHIARWFQRLLHELQRLQASRQGLNSLAPTALDVEILE